MCTLVMPKCTFLLYKSVHFYQAKLYTFVTADNQSVISCLYSHRLPYFPVREAHLSHPESFLCLLVEGVHILSLLSSLRGQGHRLPHSGGNLMKTFHPVWSLLLRYLKYV